MATYSEFTAFYYLKRNFVNTNPDRNKFLLFTIQSITRILFPWEKLPAFVEPECSSLCYQTPVNGRRSEEVTGTFGLIFLIICRAWDTNTSLTEDLSLPCLTRIKCHLPTICLYILVKYIKSRSQLPCGLRLGSAAVRLLGLRVRISAGTWMPVFCEGCVLSGRGFCVGLITRPEESYRLWGA